MKPGLVFVTLAVAVAGCTQHIDGIDTGTGGNGGMSGSDGGAGAGGGPGGGSGPTNQPPGGTFPLAHI
ncbi:MAG TPA: TRAP transporter substrate-binding protein, partial [Polyangia bacterium]